MSFRKVLWVVGFLLVLIPFLSKTAAVQAQGSRSKPASGRTDKVVLRVIVEGELQTAKMGSDIKSEGSPTKGGDASQYAVKVIRAMGKDGKELSEIEGKILHLHKNSKSQSLIKKHSEGDRLIIQGKLHVDKRLLEVNSFKEDSESQGSDTNY